MMGGESDTDIDFENKGLVMSALADTDTADGDDKNDPPPKADTDTDATPDTESDTESDTDSEEDPAQNLDARVHKAMMKLAVIGVVVVAIILMTVLN